MCLTALPLPCPAGKLSTMQGKHDAEMAVLKSKITALQAEKSKLTDKIRRTEREDADKAAEAAKVAASGINEVAQAGGGAAVEEVELTSAEKQRRNMKAPVYQHWSSPVLLQTAMRFIPPRPFWAPAEWGRR